MAGRLVRGTVITLVIAAIVGGAVMLVKHKKSTLGAAPKYGMRPMPVSVVEARMGDIRTTRSYLAVVEPFRVANVSARVTAEVNEILYDENEPVKAGDALIRLDK